MRRTHLEEASRGGGGTVVGSVHLGEAGVLGNVEVRGVGGRVLHEETTDLPSQGLASDGLKGKERQGNC